MRMRSSARSFRVGPVAPHPWRGRVTASLNRIVSVVITWAAKAGRNPACPGWCYRRGPRLLPNTSPLMCATHKQGILTPRCLATPFTTIRPSALSSPTSRPFLRSLLGNRPQKENHDSSSRQVGAGLRRSDLLFARGPEQHDGLRFELPVCAARFDDGLDVSRQPRHVARAELACVAHGFLSFDYRLGSADDDPLLAGRIPDGAGIARNRNRVSSGQASRDLSPDVRLTDVVCRFSQRRRGVVLDVAVKDMERPGCCLPHVYSDRYHTAVRCPTGNRGPALKGREECLQGLKPLKRTKRFVVPKVTTHNPYDFFCSLPGALVRKNETVCGSRLHRWRKNPLDCHSERSEGSLCS